MSVMHSPERIRRAMERPQRPQRPQRRPAGTIPAAVLADAQRFTGHAGADALDLARIGVGIAYGYEVRLPYDDAEAMRVITASRRACRLALSGELVGY